MNSIGLYYFNFRTGQHEFLDDTPTDWRDYIPQSEAAQALYGLYLKMGKSPIVAAGHVLAACAGEKFQEAAA